jgi:hypothetical protein
MYESQSLVDIVETILSELIVFSSSVTSWDSDPFKDNGTVSQYAIAKSSIVLHVGDVITYYHPFWFNKKIMLNCKNKKTRG